MTFSAFRFPLTAAFTAAALAPLRLEDFLRTSYSELSRTSILTEKKLVKLMGADLFLLACY